MVGAFLFILPVIEKVTAYSQINVQNFLAFSIDPPYNILIFFDLFFGTSSTLLEILLVDGGFNQKRNVILKIKAQKANSSLFAFFVPFFIPRGGKKGEK